MRRLTWFAIGAGAGIVAYRRVLRVAGQARHEGIVPTARQQLAAAGALAAGARAAIVSPGAPASLLRPGTAAARVLVSRPRGEAR